MNALIDAKETIYRNLLLCMNRRISDADKQRVGQAAAALARCCERHTELLIQAGLRTQTPDNTRLLSGAASTSVESGKLECVLTLKHALRVETRQQLTVRQLIAPFSALPPFAPFPVAHVSPLCSLTIFDVYFDTLDRRLLWSTEFKFARADVFLLADEYVLTQPGVAKGDVADNSQQQKTLQQAQPTAAAPAEEVYKIGDELSAEAQARELAREIETERVKAQRLARERRAKRTRRANERSRVRNSLAPMMVTRRRRRKRHPASKRIVKEPLFERITRFVVSGWNRAPTPKRKDASGDLAYEEFYSDVASQMFYVQK